jgi:hypothetical protein
MSIAKMPLRLLLACITYHVELACQLHLSSLKKEFAAENQSEQNMAHIPACILYNTRGI